MEGTLCRDSFNLGMTLGRGAYARVVIAEMKSTGVCYAMKVVEKSFIKKHNKIHSVMTERKVLSSINHPLINRLFYSFQDKNYLYFVLELCSNENLNQFINREYNRRNTAVATSASSETESTNIGVTRACELTTAVFYTAQIITALQYIHEKGIVHRDLKPENILLSSTGQIKLADFGSALLLNDGDFPEQGSGFVGTAEYVSPEVLKDEIITSGAPDLWALGCITYKLIRGRTPFFSDSEYLTFCAIKKHCESVAPVQFDGAFDDDAIDFILKLLNPIACHRLGCAVADSGETMSIHDHAFLAQVVWDDVIYSEAPSNFLASVSKGS